MTVTKEKFLSKLSESIMVLPKSEIDKTLNYYSEIIDDHMENGLNEEEATKKIGDMKEIASKILEESMYEFSPENKFGKFISFIFKIFNSKWRLLAFAILTLGFPIWYMALAPILIFLLLTFICVFAIPALALAWSVSLLWDPLTYSDLFNALYFVGLSLMAFGISALYISIFTTLARTFFKRFKKLSIKIKKLIFLRKAEK